MVEYSRTHQATSEVVSKPPPSNERVSAASTEVVSRDLTPTKARVSAASTEVVSTSGTPRLPAQRVVMQAMVEVVSRPALDPAVVVQAVTEVVTGNPKPQPNPGVYQAHVELVSLPPTPPARNDQAVVEVVSRLQFDMRIRPTDGDEWTWVPRGDHESAALFKIFHNGVWQPVPVWVWYPPMNMWIRVV